jgi:hypothetical protein
MSERLDQSPLSDQASARAFSGAGLRASALPNIFAVIVRFTEAGTNAFMIRFNRPGMILERFTRNALRPSDTHCSTLIGFIGMVRGSNPRENRSARASSENRGGGDSMPAAISLKLLQFPPGQLSERWDLPQAVVLSP